MQYFVTLLSARHPVEFFQKSQSISRGYVSHRRAQKCLLTDADQFLGFQRVVVALEQLLDFLFKIPEEG